MTPENIKARVSIYWVGEEKPFASYQDYNELRDALQTNISEDFPYSIPMKSFNIDGTHYKIESVNLELRKDTEDLHIKVGVDTSLYGERLPFNIDVNIYLAR